MDEAHDIPSFTQIAIQNRLQKQIPMKYKLFIATVLAITLGFLSACSSVKVPTDALSYDDIRGSGLANDCPTLTGTNMDSISVDAGQTYQIKALCLQPTTFLVKDSPVVKRKAGKFVEGKLLTRSSFTLDQISGELQVNRDGELTFVEQGGFDFQPVTLQIPNGERVPLLFTVKGLIANSKGTVSTLGPGTRLAGNFNVPPYRTSSFIDPKGRGLAVGYDAAVGIPIQADREKFSRQNNKSFKVGQGSMVLKIDRVNKATGEISGSFESQQPSDTDFGS
ncbi:MAG: photosystem II manganese-stabilizing polypeptide, partial [Cyanobacteria bacterium P01_A01_bin.84]